LALHPSMINANYAVLLLLQEFSQQCLPLECKEIMDYSVAILQENASQPLPSYPENTFRSVS